MLFGYGDRCDGEGFGTFVFSTIAASEEAADRAVRTRRKPEADFAKKYSRRGRRRESVLSVSIYTGTLIPRLSTVIVRHAPSLWRTAAHPLRNGFTTSSRPKLRRVRPSSDRKWL